MSFELQFCHTSESKSSKFKSEQAMKHREAKVRKWVEEVWIPKLAELREMTVIVKNELVRNLIQKQKMKGESNEWLWGRIYLVIWCEGGEEERQWLCRDGIQNQREWEQNDLLVGLQLTPIDLYLVPFLKESDNSHPHSKDCHIRPHSTKTGLISLRIFKLVIWKWWKVEMHS